MDLLAQLETVKHGMTVWDFANENWGSLAIIFTAIGGGIVAFFGALGVGIRTAWAFIAKQGQILVDGHGELVTTLKENVPIQTKTLGTLSELVKESRDHGSDLIREVADTKSAAGEISYAMEAMAESKPEDVKRYMARARQRLGLEKKAAKDSDL